MDIDLFECQQTFRQNNSSTPRKTDQPGIVLGFNQVKENLLATLSNKPH
jgi:hypothetical protein